MPTAQEYYVWLTLRVVSLTVTSYEKATPTLHSCTEEIPHLILDKGSMYYFQIHVRRAVGRGYYYFHLYICVSFLLGYALWPKEKWYRHTHSPRSYLKILFFFFRKSDPGQVASLEKLPRRVDFRVSLRLPCSSFFSFFVRKTVIFTFTYSEVYEIYFAFKSFSTQSMIMRGKMESDMTYLINYLKCYICFTFMILHMQNSTNLLKSRYEKNIYLFFSFLLVYLSRTYLAHSNKWLYTYVQCSVVSFYYYSTLRLYG